MQRAEFDAWIEAHYTELLKVARRRTNSADDAADVLHHAISAALGDGGGARGPAATRWYEQTTKPWTRMLLAIRGAAHDFREKARNRTAAQSEFFRTTTPSCGRRKAPAQNAE